MDDRTRLPSFTPLKIQQLWLMVCGDDIYQLTLNAGGYLYKMLLEATKQKVMKWRSICTFQKTTFETF